MRETKPNNFLVKLAFVVILAFVTASFVPKAVSNAAGSSSPEYRRALDLRKQGTFRASNSSITLKEDEKANGIMITGDAEELKDTVFSYGDTYDFDSLQAEYLVVDALAQRKKKIDLAFYLDNADKPFATVSLAKQKKAEIWSTIKNRCVGLSKKKMSGSHKLHFKVITQEAGSLQLVVRSVMFFKSDIPMVEFDLDESQGTVAEMNGDTNHDTECYGKVTLNIPENYQSEYSKETFKTTTYELDYIRGRGNSTWWAEKRPYKFKLTSKQDLLGMGANKHWILLANYYDVSMLRNKLTYWLGAELGMEFTPQCEFVNVVMNGQYLGSYYLCEQVRVGKSRVNIDNLEKDETTKAATDEATISGGYLLAMNPYEAGLRRVFSTVRNSYMIESPSFEDYTNEAQYNYISSYMQKTEDAIYGVDFKDDAGKSYQEYMDIDAAVDYYWIQEFSMNGDAFGSGSTYLYKKRNGKLYWGPLWDFDYVAWGATEFFGNSVQGFTQNNSTWFERLFDDPVFYQKVVDRWPAIREKLLAACADGGQIDIYSQRLYESQKANYTVLKKYSDTHIGDMMDGIGVNETPITYDSEVDRLKLWIRQRVEWVDENLANLKRTYYTVRFMVDGTEFVSRQVQENQMIGMLPEVPVKEGYIFQGWYAVISEDGKELEYQVTEDTSVKTNMTVTAKWRIKAEAKPVKQIGFARTEWTMFWDDTIQLQYCVLPFDADNSNITWSSSNPEVAVVSNGTVLPTGRTGETVITATASNGVSGSCLVHLIDYKEYESVEFIRLENTSVTVSKGGYARVQANIFPKNAVMWDDLLYASSDEEVIKVNNCGYVYGVKAGTAVVVAYSRYGTDPMFCTVTVVDDGKADVLPEEPVVPTPAVTPTPDVSPEPGMTPEPGVTPEPGMSPEPGITLEPDATPTPGASQMPIRIEPKASPSPGNDSNTVKKGTKFTVNGLKYQVLSVGDKRTVACIGAKGSVKKLTVPAAVTYKGKSYKVTKIGNNAFSGNKKLTKVILGQNVTVVGNRAFAQCKNLKEITIKSAKLTKVGKNAVAGTSPKLKLNAPKGKQAKYQKLFKL